MAEARGIEEPHFVERHDERYICTFCDHVLRPPVKQTQCGHRVCSACIDGLQPDKMCPANKEDCGNLKDIEPDLRADEELNNLQVYCRNADCKETPKWGKLAEHEKECHHGKKISCPNLAKGCYEHGKPGYIAQHLEKCKRQLKKCSICKKTVIASALPTHREECRKRLLPCPHREIGCTFQGTEEELNLHNTKAKDEHTKLECKKIANIERQLMAEKKELLNYVQELRKSGTKLQNYNEELKNRLERGDTPLTQQTILLENFKKQVEGCKYKPELCRNASNGCQFRDIRSKVEEHQRNCMYELKKCAHCGDNITTGHYQEHVLDCKNKPKKCPYSKYGCSFQGSAELVQKHLMDVTIMEKHMDYMRTRVENLESGHHIMQQTISVCFS